MKKILIILFMSIFLISVGFSSELSSPSYCCEQTIEGASCINAEESQCDSNFRMSPTSCENTAYCQEGTCYDSVEGICMENTPRKVCEENGGTWDSEDPEMLSQCQLGCCVISDQAAFVSQVRCKRLSSVFGVEVDYRSNIGSEVECIALTQELDVGACVYETNLETTCEFTTRKDCNAKEGLINQSGEVINKGSKTFYKDYLCSAEELNTICVRQQETRCYNGQVYWYDSCGNRENVYSNDKEVSWNNGRVAEPYEVCNPNDGSNKDCGNCDYLLGTRCSEYDKGILGIGKPEYGDYYCASTECSYEGEIYKNGESFCVYDNVVGEGQDVVGSRHFRYICIDGEIHVEPCADYRNEICISDVMETSGEDFNVAGCRVNRWQDCLSQTEKSDCENLDRRDCVWISGIEGLSVSTSDGEAVGGGGLCIPEFTPGQKFWEGGEVESICGQATVECEVEYEKKLYGSEKCVENCECLEEDWALQAARICRGLGDCGPGINYEDIYTNDGYLWKKDGEKQEFSPNSQNKLITGKVVGLGIVEGLNE